MSFQLVISKEWYHSFDLVLWRVNSNWGLARNQPNWMGILSRQYVRSIDRVYASDLS